MILSQHKLARTTPAVRAEIAASADSAIRLAERYNVSVATIYKWRTRDTFEDRSLTAHRLQTTLTPAQEAIVVVLRKTLLLPLDDLLAVTREFLSENVSRSGLDRCLRRHGVGNLHVLKPATPKEPRTRLTARAPIPLCVGAVMRASSQVLRHARLPWLERHGSWRLLRSTLFFRDGWMMMFADQGNSPPRGVICDHGTT